jgi:hypothetical protein
VPERRALATLISWEAVEPGCRRRVRPARRRG